MLAEWKAAGRLVEMEGVWCAVPYKITVIAAEGTAEASEAQRIVDEVFGETEKTFSHFVEDSEVSQLNRLAKKTLFKPSPAMKKVLSAAGTINRMTRGAFDPAILPLAAHYKKTPGVEPSSDLISHSKWSAFEITEEGVTKQHDSAMMDLCGLAKGWAIDEMSQRLKDFGFTASYVDWGGDIKVSGQHPTGRNWTAAVLEPYPLNGSNEPEKADEGKEAEHIAHIELRDGQAIATSGDYLQQLADDKNQKTRCHVLDGRSDKKLVRISHHSVASASVVCSSCMIADALATSALAVGETSVRESRKLLEVFTGHALKDMQPRSM